jgi:hypothetical protein
MCLSTDRERAPPPTSSLPANPSTFACAVLEHRTILLTTTPPRPESRAQATDASCCIWDLLRTSANRYRLIQLPHHDRSRLPNLRLDRQRLGQKMEKETPLKQWQDGVSLGHAWWVYADLAKKKRFRELQQAASPGDRAPAPHMGFRHALEDEVIGRLSSGELQAFGIEFGSTGEPVAIPKNYFWKGAEIDLDSDTVAALGRKFGQVTVQGKREPIVETLPEMVAVDPRQFHMERDALYSVRAEPEQLNGPGLEQRTSDTLPIAEGSAHLIEGAHSESKRRGRPSKAAEIEEVIEILLGKGINLAKLPRPQAMAEIRNCAANHPDSDINIGYSDPVLERVLFRRFGPRH